MKGPVEAKKTNVVGIDACNKTSQKVAPSMREQPHTCYAPITVPIHCPGLLTSRSSFVFILRAIERAPCRLGEMQSRCIYFSCYDPGPHFSFSGPPIYFPRHSLPTNPLSVTCHQVSWSQGVPRILLDCHVTLQAHWLLQDLLSDQ